MASKNVHIFAEDMTDESCAEAIKIAQDAFNLTISQGKVYSTIAANIRSNFDKNPSHGPGWNCVVGRSFGAFVTHEIKTYMVSECGMLVWELGE